WMNQEGAFRPALTLFIVIVITLLVATQFLVTKQPSQTLEQEERRQLTEKQEPAVAPSTERPGPSRQDLNGKQANLANQKRTQSSYPVGRERTSKNLTTARNANEASPAGHLQRIYVGNGFDTELKQALSNSFQARGISLATSEEQAAAILRAEQTRSEEMMVELITGAHQRLWWTNAKTSSDSSTKIQEIAETIVNDLLSKVETLKQNGTRQQPR